MLEYTTFDRVWDMGITPKKGNSMITPKQQKRTRRQVAEFRYSVLGHLLAQPLEAGELAQRLRDLAQRSWLEPGRDYPETFTVRTLERWYGKVKKKPADPISALLPARRSDAGNVKALSSEHQLWLRKNFRKYQKWSWALHWDNLRETELKQVPSYATVVRWMRSQSLFPEKTAGIRRKKREVRSFESSFPGELWHFDGHKGSRMVVDDAGQYRETRCIAFLDDHSRLCCHCQWVSGESAEEVVHIFLQALLKRGMPRKVQSDNGSGMIAAEFESGVKNLGIIHEKTIPRSPFQNGKIESFWRPLESRLLAMLEHVKPLTLETLNKVTQAWVEQEYNKSIHSETKEKPIDRFLAEKNVLRRTPDFVALRRAFRMIISRKQRRSDGTVTIDGVRFEVPSQYRHMDHLTLAYARWNLAQATIVDSSSFVKVIDIFPVNKANNALGHRKFLTEPSPILLPEAESNNNHLPPLLVRLLQEHSQENIIAGYIPLHGENKQ